MTNIFTSEHVDDKIPPGSIYSPCRSDLDFRAFLEGTKFATPEEYAKEVADNLMGKPGSVLWRAPMEGIARLLSYFAWPGMTVSVMTAQGRVAQALTFCGRLHFSWNALV